MFLEAFQDELVKQASQPLRKVAGILTPARQADHLLERMAVTGGLSTAALHGAQSIKSKVTRDPYGEPQGSLLGSAAKGAAGGVLAGIILKALSRGHRR